MKNYLNDKNCAFCGKRFDINKKKLIQSVKRDELIAKLNIRRNDLIVCKACITEANKN